METPRPLQGADYSAVLPSRDSLRPEGGTDKLYQIIQTNQTK